MFADAACVDEGDGAVREAGVFSSVRIDDHCDLEVHFSLQAGSQELPGEVRTRGVSGLTAVVVRDGSVTVCDPSSDSCTTGQIRFEIATTWRATGDPSPQRTRSVSSGPNGVTYRTVESLVVRPASAFSTITVGERVYELETPGSFDLFRPHTVAHEPE